MSAVVGASVSWFFYFILDLNPVPTLAETPLLLVLPIVPNPFFEKKKNFMEHEVRTEWLSREWIGTLEILQDCIDRSSVRN